MLKRVFYCLTFVLLLSGCANLSFIRHDIFSDHRSVSTIYNMPILKSVGIDKAYLANEKKKQHIQSKIDKSILLIRDIVKSDLEQKGYTIKDSGKLLSDLNPELENDNMLREVIQLASGYERIESPVRGEVTLKLDGDNAERQTFNLEDVFSDKESENAFVEKALEYTTKYPVKEDTLMFLHVSSFIGKRFLGFVVTDKSYITFKMIMLKCTELNSIKNLMNIIKNTVLRYTNSVLIQKI